MPTQKITHHIIWTSNPDFTDEERQFLKSEYPDSSDEEYSIYSKKTTKSAWTMKRPILATSNPATGFSLLDFSVYGTVTGKHFWTTLHLTTSQIVCDYIAETHMNKNFMSMKKENSGERKSTTTEQTGIGSVHGSPM